jgi:hypothetical protein
MDRYPDGLAEILAPAARTPTRKKAENNVQGDLPVEFWEPPFERWLRLADDLLRNWSGPSSSTQEHRP